MKTTNPIEQKPANPTAPASRHPALFAATVAALTLAGMSAHASCADARSGPQAGAQVAALPAALAQAADDGYWHRHEGTHLIVGTWHVSYTVEGSHFADALIQWHGDGTEWENINLPVLAGNICVGSWKPVGPYQVSRNHIGWLYTNGQLSGYFTETESDHLDTADTYSGTNDQKIYDLNGNVLAEVTGTSSAVRLAP